MIQYESVSYWYPRQTSPALSAVNWRVAAGEFVLLAGPSGSGKSTFLRLVNGLVPHFAGGRVQGRITVAGLDPIAVGPAQMSRLVGFVAQDPEAQAVLDTVEAEIAFPLENAAVPQADMRIRVEEVLDLLNLAPLRDRPLHQLSGGERQRVAIATALVFRPSILLLDEPTSQLDPQSAEDVLRALVRLNEDLALTIVLVEHRLERILNYVDRVTVLEKGRVALDAPARVAAQGMPLVPPLVELARRRGWHPLPLTVKEARPFADRDLGDAPLNPQSANGAPSISSEPLLTIERLDFAYNGHRTLKNVTLQLRAGEAVALVGRNGSGKTTLLKCVVGLLPRHTGVIHINGRSAERRAVADICREVGYLPQNPDDLLYAETVRDELQITLDNHGLSTGVELNDWLAELELADLSDRYPRDLSVGERQRVALGAVTVTRPPVVLLDEPTRGLDSAAKEALARILRRWRDEGTAILLVTHDVELAGMIADRTIMLAEGEVIADGDTHDVLGASPQFAPQIARLFPGRGWLTVADAMNGLPAMNSEE
jgi:energy-coupling factor transport system ATP-binding protein